MSRHSTATPRPSCSSFGIAKLLEQTGPALTRASSVVGTATYMSPEQIRGAAVDARSDLYAVGLCLYEMLTGKKPYDGGSMHQAMLRMMQGEPVPPHPALTPALLDFLRRATHADASARPSGALEMKRGFHDAAHASSTSQQRFAPMTQATVRTAPGWGDSNPGTYVHSALHATAARPPASMVPPPARRRSLVAVAAVGGWSVVLALGAVLWLREGSPATDSNGSTVPAPPASVSSRAESKLAPPRGSQEASVVSAPVAKPSAAASGQRQPAPAASAKPAPAPSPVARVAPTLTITVRPPQPGSEPALRAFVAHLSKCLTIPGDGFFLDLEHTATGQVTRHVGFASGVHQEAADCLKPLVDGLVGRTPAGYAPGVVTQIVYRFKIADPSGPDPKPGGG